MSDVRKLAGSASRLKTPGELRPELKEPRNAGPGKKRVQYVPRKDS